MLAFIIFKDLAKELAGIRVSIFATSSGVPSAITYPPYPAFRTQPIYNRLFSTSGYVDCRCHLPALQGAAAQQCLYYPCKPVVGSSSIYIVLPVLRFKLRESLILWASRKGWWLPHLYIASRHRKAFASSFSFGICEKSSASSTSYRTSAIFSLYLPQRFLYLLPLKNSHGTYTSGRKCISIFMMPSPLHASHLPPLTLKLNLPGL